MTDGKMAMETVPKLCVSITNTQTNEEKRNEYERRKKNGKKHQFSLNENRTK